MAGTSRVALVTGTSDGIGREVARALLAKGWSVIGVARRPAPFDQGAYRHERLDLADLAAVEAFTGQLAADPFIAAAQRLGLVNNAAQLGPMRPLRIVDGSYLRSGPRRRSPGSSTATIYRSSASAGSSRDGGRGQARPRCR